MNVPKKVFLAPT